MASRTLFNEFTIIPDKRIDIRNKDGKLTTNAIQTTLEDARLLSLGYLRLYSDQSKNIQYEDIASILCKYVAMPIEFTVSFFNTLKHRRQFHQNSLTIFQTELSYDSDFVKHLIDGGNNIKLPKLRAKLTVNECENSVYGKIGYYLQYGLIELPKSVYNKQNNNQFDFSIKMKERLSKTSPINFQSVKRVSYGQLATDYFEDLTTNYLIMGCVETPEYWTTFGQNDDWSYVKLYQRGEYVDQYCLKTNHFVDMCFEKDIKTNELYMYFLKNGQTLMQSQQTTNVIKQWQNGRFKLNLQQNYYYIGLASVICTCENGGITFEITVHET